MTFEFWYTATLLLIMTVFLVKAWIEIEIVMFSVLLLLLIGKVVTLKEAFAGFSNEGLLTIALLFVVAGALENSGMINQITPAIFGSKRTAVWRKLLRMSLPMAALSAFINNIPQVAIFIPVIKSWAERNNYAPSKFLIPLSFSVILGGICTLIGTSTNLIVHGLMLEAGMEGVGFFEIAKVGIPVTLAGIMFISFFGDYLLPNRKEPLVELGDQTREFVIELKVTAEYKNIGKSIEDAGLRHLQGLFLFQIERPGEIIAPARPEEKIMLDDRLFFTGLPKTILELQKTPGLQLLKDSQFDLKNYDSEQMKTFECVVSSGSPLIGKTVRESNFRSAYAAVIIAIHRHGKRIANKIGDIILRPGDTLLLLAEKNFYKKWYNSKDFYLVARADTIPSKPPWRGYFSLVLFVAMIVLAALEILPLLTAAGLAAIVLLLTRTVGGREAQNLIDWRVLIMIAMSFGIAAGVEKSGLAAAIANELVKLGRNFDVFGVMASVFITTSLCTTFVTNNAAAVMLFPIGISAAASIQADPRAFAITVMIAASSSFVNPISYQTNLMVYGPGGYKFIDFVKIGLPLQILYGVVAMILIYHFYF